MKISYKLSLAAMTASLSLVGCGGSSDSTPTTVTGQFVDTYVSGLNYACSSGTTGVTNNMGEYTCNEGDTVEFSLGGYVLGNTTASEGIVTPETLYPENPEAALNVAQVIQSLDTDPTDDIITIPENFTDLDDVTVTPDDENFDTVMETELGEIGVALVSEEEAQQHLDETELMLLLAGKTFYLVGSDNTGDNWIDSVVFNSDATSLTWASLTDSEAGSHNVVIEGNTITLDGDEGPFTLTFIEEASDKLVFHGIEGGAVVEEGFMFFEEADAKAYYNTLVPGTFVLDPVTITQSMLDGKTFYEKEVEYDDWNNPTTPTGYLYASMTFSNGTFTRSEIWVNANDSSDTESWSFDLPYEIIDGKVRIDASSVPDQDPQDPDGFIWLTLNMENGTEWIILLEKDADKDGNIDQDSYRDGTWYLSKPDDYPESL